MKNKIVQDLLVGLLLLILGGALNYWLSIRHSQPVIEIDSNGGLYSNIQGVPVGMVFVGNSGYKADHNISITIDDHIKKDDIDIPGFVGDYIIKDVSQGTTITINELRPSETIQIFFSPTDRKMTYFNVLGSISESNNIYELNFVDWWNIPIEIKVIIGFLIFLSGFLGWYIPKRIGERRESFSKNTQLEI